jgi:hypothetical protein
LRKVKEIAAVVTLAEWIGLVFGVILLIVGIVWQLSGNGSAAPATVKQQNIPMTIDDFKEDPRIQGIIQQQSSQTIGQPTNAVGPASTSSSSILQPNQPVQANK